jgi:general secretion pathway protein G
MDLRPKSSVAPNNNSMTTQRFYRRNLMIRSQRRDSQRGFTLMEMLVVLAILAMLLALVVPSVLGTQKKADISTAQSQIKLLKGCLQQYFLDMKEYPTTEQGFQALLEKPADLSDTKSARWNGPYIDGEELPTDPWSHDLQYEYPPKNGTSDYPDIWSMGPDGEDGTDDDIVNWSSSSEDGSGSSKSGSGSKSSEGSKSGGGRSGGER